MADNWKSYVDLDGTHVHVAANSPTTVAELIERHGIRPGLLVATVPEAALLTELIGEAWQLADFAARHELVPLLVDACDDRDDARAQRDQAIETAGQLRDQVAAGHRVQLAVAGQWLGHAAEKLGDAPAAAYLQALAEWLTGNAEGDEPEAPGG